MIIDVLKASPASNSHAECVKSWKNLLNLFSRFSTIDLKVCIKQKRSSMEDSLEILKSFKLTQELVKSMEGVKIAARLQSLSKELELLSESDRTNFYDEFGIEFDDSLSRFLPKTEDSNSGLFSTIIFILVILTFLCKFLIFSFFFFVNFYFYYDFYLFLSSHDYS